MNFQKIDADFGSIHLDVIFGVYRCFAKVF